MSTTKLTPQASCSKAGSYSPWRSGVLGMRQPQAREGSLHARDAVGPCCSTKIVHGDCPETANFDRRCRPSANSLQWVAFSATHCNEYAIRGSSGGPEEGVVAAARGAGVGRSLEAGEELVVAGPLGGGAGDGGDGEPL